MRSCLPNGLPTWLDAPDIALPRIQLTPAINDNYWLVEIMIGHKDESHYVGTRVPSSQVPDLLMDWNSSPEACCRKWFHHEPPHGSAPPPDTNPEDLGL